MKKTTNYQLSQWDATDRILREDFNGDNAKIDAALKAEETARKNLEASAAKYVKLKDITLSQTTTYVEVNVSDIRWADWQNVHLDISLQNGSQGTLFANQVTVGGGPSNRICGISPTWNNPMPRETLSVGKMPQRLIAETTQYNQTTQLIFCDATYGQGGRLVIWGEA